MPVILDYGLRLPVHQLAKKALALGAHVTGSWGWARDGETIASLDFAIGRDGPLEASLHLSCTIDGEITSGAMMLVAEPCRFGGLRWYAICPVTGLKVSKLYLPPGARRFLARKAWRLAYASQNVSSGFHRLCDQRDRLLARKLKSNDPDFPLKPKGMRRHTYVRHLERLDRLHMAMDRAFLQRFGMDIGSALNNSGNFGKKRRD